MHPLARSPALPNTYVKTYVNTHGNTSQSIEKKQGTGRL